MEAIIILVLLLASLAGNAVQRHQLVNRPAKVEYKEIEVVKRAMCECGHVSSVHKNGVGSCQQQLFRLDGLQTNKAYTCFCDKYTGPKPITEYFDDQMRELESVKPKELK